MDLIGGHDMDFAALPPEINSGRIYVGPGSGPMLAAAAAWDALAASLHSTASAYQSEITALTGGPWVGPASESMAAAAAPYVEWMRTTAGLAEQAANQAKVAAAAYETAFAATVPPPVIAANRSLLMTLIATNILGQNTPAIATTETQYAEMWAQDAATMYGYAGSAASATTLTPFTPPQQNTNSGADQPAAVTQATGTAAGNTQNAVSTAQQAFSSVPNSLTSLAAPAAAADPPSGLDLLSDLISVFLDAPASAAGLAIDSPGTLISLPFDVVGALTGFHTDDIVSGWAGIQSWPGYAPIPPTAFPVITNLAGGSVGGGPALAAGLGEANTVGGLSVPPGWAAAAPAIRPAALALPSTSLGAAAQAAQATSGTGGNLFGEMAAAGMAGRAMAGTGGAGRTDRAQAAADKPTAKSKDKPTQDPAAPPQVLPGGPITSIAAELRELASLRDAGILTEAEFNEQKQRLLPH
jgi:PPE-repeat protein